MGITSVLQTEEEGSIPSGTTIKTHTAKLTGLENPVL